MNIPDISVDVNKVLKIYQNKQSDSDLKIIILEIALEELQIENSELKNEVILLKTTVEAEEDAS